MSFSSQNTKIRYLFFIAFITYLFVDFVYLPYHTIFPDESRFVSEAIKFANTLEFWTGDSRAWEMPLTGIVYGIFIKIFGHYYLFAIRIFQAILLLIDGWLVCKITYFVFKETKISKISLIITLFYPFFIYYQGLLLSESIFIFLLLSSFYFLYKWKEEDFKIDKNFVLSIMFFVLSIYAKATLTILPIVLFPFFAFLYKGLKYSSKIFLFTLILYCIFMGSWWIRNYEVLGKTVIFTTSGGSNLYLGNNKYNKNGGCDWRKDVDKKWVKKLKSSNLSEIEKNNLFKQKAIEFIRNNPDKFLILVKDKFIRFWNIQFNNKGFRNSVYNYIMFFSFTPILLLFLWSLFLIKNEWKILSPMFILILYYTILHSLIIASIRYRLPIEPFMIIIASFGIYKLIKK